MNYAAERAQTIYPMPDALPDLLEEANQLQGALNNAQALAGMLPRAISEQEAATVKAALTGRSEDRERLEVAMHEVRMATDAKNTADLLRGKLATNAKAIEAARSREKAHEAAHLRKLFADKYTAYKAQCEQVRNGLKELLRMNDNHRVMTGNDCPGFGESRERWLNLPAIAGHADDVSSFSTGEML